MIQNSLERLLDGLATALRHDVAPAVDDEFARRQALVGAEILEHLVSRVRWRDEDLTGTIAVVRPLLERADRQAPGAPGLAIVRTVLAADPSPSGDALEGARTAHLEALAAVQAWAVDAAEADESLRADLAAAAGRLLAAELRHLRDARDRARRSAAGRTVGPPTLDSQPNDR